jgi:hypothetical protein
MNTIYDNEDDIYNDLVNENLRGLRNKLLKLKSKYDECSNDDSELLYDNQSTYYLISIDSDWFESFVIDLLLRSIEYDLENSMKTILDIFPFLRTKYNLRRYIFTAIDEHSQKCLQYMISEYERHFSDYDCNWRTFVSYAISEEETDSARFIQSIFGN